jgi:hypothetical protein
MATVREIIAEASNDATTDAKKFMTEFHSIRRTMMQMGLFDEDGVTLSAEELIMAGELAKKMSKLLLKQSVQMKAEKK